MSRVPHLWGTCQPVCLGHPACEHKGEGGLRQKGLWWWERACVPPSRFVPQFRQWRELLREACEDVREDEKHGGYSLCVMMSHLGVWGTVMGYVEVGNTAVRASLASGGSQGRWRLWGSPIKGSGPHPTLPAGILPVGTDCGTFCPWWPDCSLAGLCLDGQTGPGCVLRVHPGVQGSVSSGRKHLFLLLFLGPQGEASAYVSRI